MFLVFLKGGGCFGLKSFKEDPIVVEREELDLGHHVAVVGREVGPEHGGDDADAGDALLQLKWNHSLVLHAVFWLFSRNVLYLLNFSLPL